MKKELTASRIAALLSPEGRYTVECHRELPSTSSYLHEAAEQGAPHGQIVIAERQSAGRGRRGRRFDSPEGVGLYMSLLLRVPLPEKQWLTPYVAVCAAEAIEAVCPVKVGIKWVNDLWIAEKKIAGILTEGAFAPDGSLSYAVVGIGINVHSRPFPAELCGIAAAIEDHAPAPDRAVLAAEVIRRVYDGLPVLQDGSFMAEYRRRSVLIGRRVGATVNGAPCFGIAEAIEQDGALRLRTEAGAVTLQAGEVSLIL